jgi:hypothetical protein
MSGSCNDPKSLSLYCSPAENSLLYENQTYGFDYNSQFWTIWGNKSVDIYLYHANGDHGVLARQILGLENSGEMLFTIDQVWIFRGKSIDG